VEDDPSLKKNKVIVTCDPERIRPGETATVTWSCVAVTGSSSGASTEDGNFTTGGDTEGSAEVSPLRDATYVVRCKDKFDKEFARKSCKVEVSGTQTNTVFTGIGATGTNSQSSSNGVPAKPTVRIMAEPPAAPSGTAVRVTWKSQNTASCVVYGPGCDTFGKDSSKCFKEVGRAGYVTGKLFETSLFRVECLAPDRKTRVSDTVTVEVASEDEEDAIQEGE
jgi:hypothetical protein